ncbi:hypothetical protein [Modestobacter sp. DSM 44400]|uniref:hypothetical protein n=1 Tax=Modestobacter sp. DSM 44400 TaxID=1550230 RepID=UPI0011152A61|nr:hypothetical protein [Modestobacter sp. DSM 44400]
MDLRPRSDDADADASRRARRAGAETRATGDFFYAPVTPGLANRSVTVHSGALMALGADVLSHRGDIGLAVLRFAPAGG